jgi:hypothetical protein
MKQSIQSIIQPLTIKSSETGIVPNKQKLAKFIPIFKSSKKDELKNYRPVSFFQRS